MKIICIRHGQTTGDVENRYGGDYDDHLSDEGIRQVNDMLSELERKDIELIISSPLIRAQETAQIVSSLGCPVIIEPGFKERNQYAALSGMTKAEALEKFPESVEKLKNRLNTIEGAESYEDFSDRISESFQKVLDDREHDCVAIIWHGGPMRCLFRDILNKGELKEIGDCAWAELEYLGGQLFIKNLKRIELA